MSKLKDQMFYYFSSKNIIFEMFDEDGWETIENQVDKRWFYDGEGLLFLDDEGCEYGYDHARKCGNTIDGVELYHLQDNGEKYYAMFSESLKCDEDEYEEEIGKEI